MGSSQKEDGLPNGHVQLHICLKGCVIPVSYICSLDKCVSSACSQCCLQIPDKELKLCNVDLRLGLSSNNLTASFPSSSHYSFIPPCSHDRHHSFSTCNPFTAQSSHLLPGLHCTSFHGFYPSHPNPSQAKIIPHEDGQHRGQVPTEWPYQNVLVDATPVIFFQVSQAMRRVITRSPLPSRQSRRARPATNQTLLAIDAFECRSDRQAEPVPELIRRDHFLTPRCE